MANERILRRFFGLPLLYLLASCADFSAEPTSAEPSAASQLAAGKLLTIDEWLEESGYPLSEAQRARLEEAGELMGVVPEARLPVKHRTGLIEALPQQIELAGSPDELDPEAQLRRLLQLKLWDPDLQTHRELAWTVYGEEVGTEFTPYKAVPACVPEDGDSTSQCPGGTPECRVDVQVMTTAPQETGDECDCWDGPFGWGSGSCTKSAVKEARASVTLVATFSAECPDGTVATVVGPTVNSKSSYSAALNTPDPREYGAAVSGNISVAGATEIKANESHAHQVDYRVGSAQSGTQTSESHAGGNLSASGTGEIKGAPLEKTLSGSVETDVTMGYKTSKTFLFSESVLTATSSSILRVDTLLDPFEFVKGGRTSATRLAAADFGALSCGISHWLLVGWSSTYARISVSAMANASCGQPTCQLSVPGTCNVTCGGGAVQTD